MNDTVGDSVAAPAKKAKKQAPRKKAPKKAPASAPRDDDEMALSRKRRRANTETPQNHPQTQNDVAVASSSSSSSSSSSQSFAAVFYRVISLDDEQRQKKKSRRTHEAAGADTMFHEAMECDTCKVPLLTVDNDSHLVCPACGVSAPHFDATSSVTAYGDGVDFPTFNYKRSGHFDDRLAQMQGRERKIIPAEDLERIMVELKRRRVKTPDITRTLLQDVLKSLDMRAYYKYMTQLLSRIAGKQPPRMTPEQEEVCRRMFTAAQAPFEKYKPEDRCNFSSYAFVLYKICELQGYDEFLPHFPLLKGARKLAEQDDIWSKICKELDWEFIPTTKAPVSVQASRQLDLEAMARRRDRLFLQERTSSETDSTTAPASRE